MAKRKPPAQKPPMSGEVEAVREAIGRIQAGESYEDVANSVGADTMARVVEVINANPIDYDNMVLDGYIGSGRHVHIDLDIKEFKIVIKLIDQAIPALRSYAENVEEYGKSPTVQKAERSRMARDFMDLFRGIRELLSDSTVIGAVDPTIDSLAVYVSFRNPVEFNLRPQHAGLARDSIIELVNLVDVFYREQRIHRRESCELIDRQMIRILENANDQLKVSIGMIRATGYNNHVPGRWVGASQAVDIAHRFGFIKIPDLPQMNKARKLPRKEKDQQLSRMNKDLGKFSTRANESEGPGVYEVELGSFLCYLIGREEQTTHGDD